MDYIKIDLKEI